MPRLDGRSQPIRGQRLNTIRSIVHRDGAVRVSDLADALDVSKETVRRYLVALERSGELERSHGGALRASHAATERPHDVRARSQLAAKKSIAAVANGLIAEGDSVAIDSSTTTLAMSSFLRGRGITVVTNSVLLAAGLAGEDVTKVILTGGTLDHSYMSLVGPVAEDVARAYHPDFAFISTPAISRVGITDVNDLQVAVKQQLVSGARRVCVVADHSKFGRTALKQILGWEAVDILITDEPPPEEIRGFLEDLSVQVLFEEKSSYKQ